MDKRVHIKDPIQGWTNIIQDWDALTVGCIFRQVHPVSSIEWVETATVYKCVSILENDPLGGITVDILEE
jgi:hypothetical protein